MLRGQAAVLVGQGWSVVVEAAAEAAGHDEGGSISSTTTVPAMAFRSGLAVTRAAVGVAPGTPPPKSAVQPSSWCASASPLASRGGGAPLLHERQQVSDLHDLGALAVDVRGWGTAPEPQQ